MDAQSSTTQGSSLSPDKEGLELPDGLELQEKIGSGKFTTVYRVSFQGETVALKAYTPAAVDHYRTKLGKNVAVFEMAQNRTFRHVPDLLPYTAKPLRVIGQDGSCSLCFLQEYVDGIRLEELGRKLGRIPGYLLKTGEMISRVCQDRKIGGIDQFMQNILMREKAGTWIPVIHDFKHIPSAKEFRHTGSSLLARLGLGGKRGPHGFMEEWYELDRKLEKSASA